MRMIPKNKMSKRLQKELNAQKRVEWGFKPVTRVTGSGKAYNRQRENRSARLYMEV